MKETSSFIIIFANMLLLVTIILLCIACKTVSVLDYENELSKKFTEGYSFSNTDFDIYRKDSMLFLTYFVRHDYNAYRLYLDVFSLTQQTYDTIIDKVELLSDNGVILFTSEKITRSEQFAQEKNGLFVISIPIIDSISQQQLPKGNYIVKIYCESNTFVYQFYPKEHKYVVAISQ
jgi:hypothetical protein